ncbi:MAG: hypothetical protein QXD44_03565, partial [Candidatus Nezhaarchaeales archaeon]
TSTTVNIFALPKTSDTTSFKPAEPFVGTATFTLLISATIKIEEKEGNIIWEGLHLLHAFRL